MKGLRTLLLNGAVAAGVAFLTYVVGIEWSQHVSETWALIILAAANFGLRFLTNTSVGQSE